MSIWDSDDVKVDDFVALKYDSKGGYREGFIQYIGALGDKSGLFFGVSLSAGEGSHDGCFRGERKFQTHPFKGVFVTENKIDRKLLIDPVSQRHLDEIKNLPWLPASPTRRSNTSPQPGQQVRTNMVTKRKAGPRDVTRSSSGWRPPDWGSDGVKRSYSKRRTAGQDRGSVNRARKRSGSSHRIIFGKPGGADIYADRGKHRTGPGVDYATRSRQQRRSDRHDRDSHTPQPARRRTRTDADRGSSRRSRSANATPRGNRSRSIGSPDGYGDELAEYDWDARFGGNDDDGLGIDDEDAKSSAPTTPGGTRKRKKHKRGVSWGRNQSREFIRLPGELEHEIIQSGDDSSPKPPDLRSDTLRSVDSDTSTAANPAYSRSNTLNDGDDGFGASNISISYGGNSPVRVGGMSSSRSAPSSEAGFSSTSISHEQAASPGLSPGLSTTSGGLSPASGGGRSPDTRSSGRSSSGGRSPSGRSPSGRSSGGGSSSSRSNRNAPVAQEYKLKIELSFQCNDPGVEHLKRRTGIQAAVSEVFDIEPREVVSIVALAAPEGFTLAFEVIIRSEFGVGEYLSTFDSALDAREFQQLLQKNMRTDDEPYVYLFEASYEKMDTDDSRPSEFEEAVSKMRR